MANVYENKGYECVGIMPYDFVPEGETKHRTGVSIWFLEGGRSGCFGCIPFKASFSDARIQQILGNLGFSSLGDLIGNFYEVTYNRWGKVDSFVLVGSR